MIQTVTNNSPQQINAALFALDNSLENKTASLEKDIEALKKNIKEDSNDDGIVSGKTYDINISGNADTADYATRAEQDADGNTISSTYVKLEDLPNEVVTGVKGDAETTYRTGNVNITPANIGAATSADITNAINALDVAEVGGGGKYISKIKETDGKISATVTTMDTTPTSASTKAVTSGGVYTAISNEATARDTAITNAINALDVASVGGNTKYISAISETDGKISATVKDVAQTYSSTGTTAASGKAIAAAINTLDVSEVGGDGKYISAISETDGKISATATSMDTAPTTNSTKAVTSGGIQSAISTAETNAKDLANATGTLAIDHGGTGTDSQANINTNFIADLSEGTSDVTDGTMFVSSYASDNGFSDTNAVNKPYKRKFSHVWNYIKGKISSVLGLTATNYGGKASTAGTADNADRVNIGISDANVDFPLLFTTSVTAGNKYTYTDTANEASYNPSTNALKIKGSIFSNGYQQKRYYDIDASSLSTSNFYPVTFGTTDLELDCEIHSPNVGGGSAYNQNLIHFLLIAQGWSDTPKRLVVLQYGVFDANEITLGSIAYGNRGGTNCIWVRGGLRYRFYSNQEPTLRNSNYTTDSQTFTVGSGYAGSGSNTNVTTIWTPNTSFVGAFSGLQSGVITNSNASKSLCDTVDISTAGATAAKTASLPGFVLKKGSRLLVNLVNANTVANATLNVNGTGAKTVYINGGNAVTTSNWTAGIWYAVYDGTYWRLDDTHDAYAARYAVSADYPTDFSSRSANATWGNQTGATVTAWNESDGGSIDFRKNNPSAGKLSVKVDGRYYMNEGNTPVAGLKSANSFWGMTDPDGNDNVWIRTTNQGIIPYQSGNAGSGHNYIGTSSWYFAHAYIDQIHGYLNGNISGSSTSCTGNSATATKATQDGNGNNIASTYATKDIVSINSAGLAPIVPTGPGMPRYLMVNSSGTAWEPYNSITVGHATSADNADNADVASYATTAYKIRTSAPSSPEVGDIWIS